MNQAVKSYNARTNNVNWVKLIACVSSTVIAGFLSVWLSGAWLGYENINVASLSPVPYLSGIIWSILYVMMAISLYTVIDCEVYTVRSQRFKTISVSIWASQFLMILLLPFLVYSQGLFMLGFVVSALISAFLASLSIINLKINTTASVLLLPIFAWMLFESYLNLIITINNF